MLASCDAFDNFPPGLTGRTLLLAGTLPPLADFSRYTLIPLDQPARLAQVIREFTHA